MKTLLQTNAVFLFLLSMLIISCSKEDDNTPGTSNNNSSSQASAPEALFEAQVDQMTVNFVNKSKGKGLSYSWDFGDGNTSQKENPQHTYSADGTFTVKLTATNILGKDVKERDVIIEKVTQDLTAVISRNWIIDEAYGNGNPDPGTTGKTIEFNKNGTYIFNGNFNGTWEFTNNQERVLLDKGKSHKQDWEIITLTSKKFDVKFISPFDGSKLQWVMKPN